MWAMTDHPDSLDSVGSAAPLLELRDVRVFRGGKVALDHINLRIDAREHVAILGPNGCGKSTLIKTITRECYPAAREGSSMTILGRSRWNIFELRNLLGIVSNDLMLSCTGYATGLDVVASGFFSAVRVFPHHAMNETHWQRARAALERMEVLHLADRPVEEMSSGEAKRVLIARALVHEPKTLIFDEPSNSLDVFAQHSLREIMHSLAVSGTGVVLVTHHISDIIPEIERVVLMRGGRILADGAKEEMLVPARLAELFGVPVEIARRDGYFHLW
jgi:iron complex transport system ATP-binding protein